ncbi:MAG TPA: hypothetical protein VEP49_08835 [Acidimicrobiia bacterium]|nr:hypothetical protein [Acidimicrobiia bacterium]
MTTVQFVVATAMSLFVFVLLANFVVDLYARGAIRAAVDEGARAGAPVDASLADCERRADDALDDLLGGAMRRGVQVRCVADFGTIRARADVVLPGWIPGIVPDWWFSITGTAISEHDP